MQITGVDFLLTFKCTSQCRHCSYRAGPDQSGFIDLKNARRWLVELKQLQPLEGITIHGGEPFLYFDVMKAILKKAKELQIQKRWVITNGYWAENTKTTETRLQELKGSGLTAITFSVDAFHQEYTPFENVKRGIRIAVDTGFDTVAVDSYFLGSDQDENDDNCTTRKLLNDLADIDGVEFSRFPLSFEGRAADLLIDKSKETSLPAGSCRTPFWLGEDLKNPDCIEIDCQGNVTLCPGISIGNIYRDSLSKIIGYNWRSHPIIKVIVEQGPIGLLKIVDEDFTKNRRFIDECHLCYELRRYLLNIYPQYLAPRICYELHNS